MLSLGAKERVLEVLVKHGDKAEAVLRAALSIALKNREGGGSRLGDFDYHSVVKKLRLDGIDYNPSSLLNLLERDYGVIETTYRSSGGRHWWRFIDMRAVQEALAEYKGVPGSQASPRLKALRAKVMVLEPRRLLNTLFKMEGKNKLSEADKLLLKRLALVELDVIVDLIDELEKYAPAFSEEIEMLHEIVDLVYRLSLKLNTGEDVKAKLEETYLMKEHRGF